MDPLGKKGEQALEGVQNVSQRLEQLESHLTAVDSALQDFMEDSRSIMEHEHKIEQQELEKLDRLEKREKDSEGLEERIHELERDQHVTRKKVEELMDRDLRSIFRQATESIKKVNRASRNLRKDLKSVENKVNELENDLIVEINRRDYDFDQKLDKPEFEADKAEMMEEIRKLRASVHILADELDKRDEIEVE